MELHEMGAVALGEAIRRGVTTAEAVVRNALDRVEAQNDRLHAFVHVAADAALRDARIADAEIGRGFVRGPLHGVPMGVKDLIDVAGLPTTCGTTFRNDAIPDKDATAVARLRRAGAIILGTVTMTEGALLTHNPRLPRPLNPWGEALWTGGSSSGSGVAVAARLCHGTLGTDTGGSVRMPSACCGVTGIKPTWGLVSQHGLFPMAPSFDHIGPLARSAEDAAAMLQAMAGKDALDSSTSDAPVPDYLAATRRGVAGLRIGIDWEKASDGIDADMVAALRSTLDLLASRGAIVREIRMPDLSSLLSPAMAGVSGECSLIYLEELGGHDDEIGTMLRHSLSYATNATVALVVRSGLARLALRQALTEAIDQVDVVAMPTLACPVPTWEGIEDLITRPERLTPELTRFVMPYDASGHPAISLPAGVSGDGRPLSIQFVAAHFREDLLFQVGHAIQSATDHHLRRPPLNV